MEKSSILATIAAAFGFLSASHADTRECERLALANGSITVCAEVKHFVPGYNGQILHLREPYIQKTGTRFYESLESRTNGNLLCRAFGGKRMDFSERLSRSSREKLVELGVDDGGRTRLYTRGPRPNLPSGFETVDVLGMLYCVP